MLALVIIGVVAVFAVPAIVALAFARTWPWFAIVSVVAITATALVFPSGHAPIESCSMGSCDGTIVANIYGDLIRPWLWGTMILLIAGRGIWLATRKRV